MGEKKRTHEIFGEFIDTYTIRESEADGATVPILYEGRTTRGAVTEGRDLDEVFEDMFAERTAEELDAIKKRWATKGNVLEAPKMIEAKARDMLRHYVDGVMPNGFKAQVVATSRLGGGPLPGRVPARPRRAGGRDRERSTPRMHDARGDRPR